MSARLALRPGPYPGRCDHDWRPRGLASQACFSCGACCEREVDRRGRPGKIWRYSATGETEADEAAARKARP